MVKLSVVIPVYNTEKYLSECIDSVLSQTFRDYEIILVDDGSSDNSAAICAAYEANHPCIKLIRQSNRGASAARNAGIKAAAGEYIHFIDSDDLLPDADVYSRISQYLDGVNQIVFSRRIRFRDGEDRIDAVQPEYDHHGVFHGDVLNHVLSHKYVMTLTCPVNKIILRSLITDHDLYFREGLNHEEDEWLPKVIAWADAAYFDDGILYKVRVRKGSLSEIPSEENRTDKACSKVIIAASGMDYMEQKPTPQDTMPLIAEYYWEYFTDACSTYRRLSAPNRQRLYRKIKENRRFFRSCRYLKSRNKRLMGRMLQILGIRPTVKLIGIRYGK